MKPAFDMSDIDRGLMDVIGLIYAATTDPVQWVATMDRLSAMLGGICGNCAVLRPRNQEEAGFWAASKSTPAGILEPYFAYYHEKDIVMDAIQGRPDLIRAPGAVRNLVSKQVFTRSEIYNDYLKPGGAEDVLLLAIGGRSQLTPLTLVNIFKERWEDDSDERAHYVLDKLKPHFERALGLHWQLAEARLHSSMMIDGFADFGIGLALLDRQGQVLLLNSPAEAMLAARDGLILSNRRLVAQNREDAAALERMLGSDDPADPGGAMAVRRPSGARSFILSVTPAREGSLAHRFGASMLYIKDPDAVPLPDPERLRRLFGLSPTEAKLCAALAAGRTMREFAEAAGISQTTAKTHLRGAFTKTDTSRQTDLVRLVLASLPGARSSR